jgi:hypothetical protein
MSEDANVATVPDTERRLATLARVQHGEALDSAELALILRMSRSTFARHLAAGAFDKFRLAPQIGRPLFSGVLVARYLAGDPLYVPTFGRRRGAR